MAGAALVKKKPTARPLNFLKTPVLGAQSDFFASTDSPNGAVALVRSALLMPSRLFLFMKLPGYEKGISDAEANWQEFRLGPNAQVWASLAHQT